MTLEYNQLYIEFHVNKDDPAYVITVVEKLIEHIRDLEDSLTTTRKKFFAETAKFKKDYEFLEDEYSNLEHTLRIVVASQKNDDVHDELHQLREANG